MTQNPSLPDPHEWHTSELNPCPVCGLTKKFAYIWEHRAVRPDEELSGKFLKRLRGTSYHGRKLQLLTAFGNPTADVRLRKLGPHRRVKQNAGNRTELRGERGRSGPLRVTRDRIQRATSLLANGKTRNEVAAILKVNLANVNEWQFTYPGLWNVCYDSAMLAVRETVRQLAGTSDMPEDINTFVLAGLRANTWSVSRGEQLFEREGLTLPQFYEQHYLAMRPQGKLTMEHHRIILRRWAILTGDPAVTEITKDTLALFRDCLSKMRGLKSVGYMSPNTVGSYLKKMQALLDKCGPAGWRNRDAMEIIPRVPWVKPPRGVRRVVRIVSDETLNHFYAGCIAAKRPKSPDFKPAAWWRGLIVLLYNSGLRRGTVFKIRMRWVDWGKRCIFIPPEVTKTGQEQIIPMNQTVFDHLQRIRGEREYLFDFAHGIDRNFYAYFHLLQDECGIPQEEHFGLHQLRKTCATVMWEHSPQVAQFVLGHTTLGTTARHYVRGQGMLQRAAEQMPQPSAFCNGHVADPAPAEQPLGHPSLTPSKMHLIDPRLGGQEGGAP